ncbi:MAG: NACHT domain-containing protein [Hyphomicrobiaceae bacterium]|nr:NACHT domain-containing protein [Hyphomicrobiaceae bacterium]
MADIDPNAIITQVILSEIEKTIESVKGAFKGAYDQAKAKLNVGYSDYIKRNYAKCAQIKTILYRHQPVLLKKHYVSPHLNINKKRVGEDEIFESLAEPSRIVITGTAGSGKSLFMKNAYLEFVNQGKRMIPIFIELRGLNDESSKTLKSFIFSEISRISPAITEEFFDLGLKHGSFALFLDGFDEIDYKQTKKIEKEVLALAAAHSKCTFIVSSRVDECFFAWQDFKVYRILPMNKNQIVELISKIEYEEIVKTKFIKRIEGELFQSHEEFLSNPLLATIMLLTFEQIADIPEKMHIFYQQAFETLFQRHDATKEMYKRERYTTFPMDEFKKYLGAFCLVTYLDQKFSFDEETALAFLDEAFELEGSSIGREDKEKFLKDLLMSVCMLQKDGVEVQFSHRSFQEYFCAYYLCQCDPGSVGKLLDEIVPRVLFDRTLALIRDMNPELFDRYWTLPRLRQIIGKVQSIDPKTHPKEFLKLFCDQLIVIKQPKIVHFREKGRMGRNWFLIRFIYLNESFSMEKHDEKIALIEKSQGPIHKEAMRVRYPLEDLPADLVGQLLRIDGRHDDKALLAKLNSQLMERYARKDEQMDRLIAKARK